MSECPLWLSSCCPLTGSEAQLPQLYAVTRAAWLWAPHHSRYWSERLPQSWAMPLPWRPPSPILGPLGWPSRLYPRLQKDSAPTIRSLQDLHWLLKGCISPLPVAPGACAQRVFYKLWGILVISLTFICHSACHVPQRDIEMGQAVCSWDRHITPGRGLGHSLLPGPSRGSPGVSDMPSRRKSLSLTWVLRGAWTHRHLAPELGGRRTGVGAGLLWSEVALPLLTALLKMGLGWGRQRGSLSSWHQLCRVVAPPPQTELIEDLINKRKIFYIRWASKKQNENPKEQSDLETVICGEIIRQK